MVESGKNKDRIFAAPRKHIVDFAFDADVAEVFPDMIRRSVPGYDTLITSLAVIAEHYYQPGSRIYDLGCSHGAATLAAYSRLADREASYIAIDNSAAMICHCQRQFSRHMSDADVQCLQKDIRDIVIEEASVVIVNLTMQFLPPGHRQTLVDRIYNGLKPGGALILTEKMIAEDDRENDLQIALYHHFKSANGYSDLEISQKRTALENVMKLDSFTCHSARMTSAGFSSVSRWFQCFNFVSLLAVR